MNFYERDLAFLERRIKKIEENPDPLRLRSNKLYYELERDSRIEQLEAWHAGKPFIRARFPQLTKAMGFQELDAGFLSNRRTVLAPEEVLKALRSKRAEGFPINCCDGTLMTAEIVLSGDLPQPSLMLDWSGCDAVTLSNTVVAHLLDVPIFHFDVGLEVTEDNLQYVTNQIGEFIEFAESKVPGVKYNEDKLAELIEIDHMSDVYFHDLYELRKRVPCPVPARDAMRLPRLPSYFPDPEKALEWLRAYRDELYERAEAGVSTVNEEKLRLMWTMTAPLYRNVFAQCERRGVAIPTIQTVYVSEFYSGYTFREADFGRDLSPIEKQAIPLLCLAWGGPGTRWIDDILATCRDMKVDAIVNFLQQGCTPTLGLKKLIADRAEKELGIPTLQIEGAYHDSQYINDDEFDAKLDDFIDMCLARKGVR